MLLLARWHVEATKVDRAAAAAAHALSVVDVVLLLLPGWTCMELVLEVTHMPSMVVMMSMAAATPSIPRGRKGRHLLSLCPESAIVIPAECC